MHHILVWALIAITQVIQYVNLHRVGIPVRECSVYEANKNNKLEFELKSSKFSISFLRANSTTLPTETLIYIYFKKEIEFVQLFINKVGAPVLRYKQQHDGKEMEIKSGPPLQLNKNFPSWYTFIIQINKKKVTVRRPDFIHLLVKGEVPVELPEKFQRIVVTTTSIQHFVFNCVTKCPIFHSADVNKLLMSFNKSFEVHLTSGIPATKFNYSLSAPSKNGNITKLSADIYMNKETILELNITRSKTDSEQCTLTNLHEGTVKATLEEHNCINQSFTFIAYKSENLSWSFNCEHYKDKKVVAHLDQKNLSSKRPLGISVGELVAWIIASLSLTGLIIGALMLYTKVTNNTWMVGGTESTISESHINNMEMVASPKVNKSMFFRELRKPEVGSVTRGRESNVSLDKLYPLKFEMEDNRSQRDMANDFENFSSIRSDKTTITTISNF